MRVLVAGATGLVGSACVRQLTASPRVARVVALVRRPWPETPEHPKLSVVQVDLAAPDAGEDTWTVDAVICALGTTMKQAGSQEAFRRVDHEYPLSVARTARARGVRHFLLVTAIGADPSSRIFYNRVKGEAERDIRALRFDAFTIARPSMLLGERRERRPIEEISSWFTWLAPPRWKPVHAEQVAAALVARAVTPSLGERIMENADLRRVIPE